VIYVVDDLGREISFERLPERIVSLVPSLTETACTFGQSHRLVGATRHCTQPATGLERLARVGGTKNPDIDAITALRPDLVLVNAEENRREDFDKLVQNGIAVVVTYPRRAADVPALLRLLGTVLGADACADAAAIELERTLALYSTTEARWRAFCPVWKNPWMSFNGETYADDLLSLVGASNIFRTRPQRYFEVSLDEVAVALPDVILLPDEPYVFRRKDLPALAPLASTPALRSDRVHFVDGKALFWFGTRTSAALAYLRAVLERTE